MSLERAYVNCERCFAIAGAFLEPTEEERVKRAYRDKDVSQARNEAMRALEEEKREIADSTNSNLYVEIAQEALKACRGCDYSSPRICETIKGTEKE